MRQYTAERINYIANHPSVLPWVSPEGPIDLTGVVADERNIVLVEDEGGIVAHWAKPGHYEIHTQFTDKVRGAEAVRVTRKMLHYLFTETDADLLCTQIPTSNPAAKGLVRAIYGEYVCSGHSELFGDVDYYSLSKERWLTAPYNKGQV